ncbi:MAG: hypothetical protein GY814_19250 [Gammaproteobacteria bacterium]|nr:hypothetical protein [Gammaproteobacteria bacterium]
MQCRQGGVGLPQSGLARQAGHGEARLGWAGEAWRGLDRPGEAKFN